MGIIGAPVKIAYTAGPDGVLHVFP
ncbi:MAG: hypothetical protein PWP05_887, partial [Thermovirga sp.]|nr:hypothetical protein [Thermovirga sp.]